jgi:ABC-2 type transport system ATP-binding protein
MEPWAIETHNLHKVFRSSLDLSRPFRKPRSVTAVAGVDLQVHRGELFGLLGPNGAGKTTLIKMLCTLIVPTAGRARVVGYDLSQEAAIKGAVGLVVSDERSFYWRLSARRNLSFFAAMAGLSGEETRRRVDEVLSAVDLSDLAGRRFGELSTGMRQRLAIARGLLHRPLLLFMDEPTRSLDPLATARLHELVRRLVRDEGMTVLLTTHNLLEAESLCGRVALMHRGGIRACATPDQLRRELWPGDRYRLQVDRAPAAAGVRLEALASEVKVRPGGDGTTELQFRVDGDSGTLTAVLDALRGAGITILSVRHELPTLEEVFAHYAEPEA